MIRWSVRTGPLVEPRGGGHLKDPCPVFDGARWHLYGTGFRGRDGCWRASHALSDDLEGPWAEAPPARLEGVDGGCVGAPGLVAGEGGDLHLFAQTDFAALGSTIEHLVSVDGGDTFVGRGTAVRPSRFRQAEAGVYDGHPSEVGGQPWLAYAAFARPGRPDLFVATSQSGSWAGPWKRHGRVLAHAQVAAHHNAHGDPAYEWGLEGPQLVELPDGATLLNAVCFLPGAPAGTRQRVFFAVGPGPAGPFRSIGPVLDPPPSGWESGENGHAAAVIRRGALWLFYQARPRGDGPWRWGLAVCSLTHLAEALSPVA